MAKRRNAAARHRRAAGRYALATIGAGLVVALAVATSAYAFVGLFATVGGITATLCGLRVRQWVRPWFRTTTYPARRARAGTRRPPAPIPAHVRQRHNPAECKIVDCQACIMIELEMDPIHIPTYGGNRAHVRAARRAWTAN